jgi:hypothetical protein
MNMAITFIFILLAVGILAFAVITQPFYEVSLNESKGKEAHNDPNLAAAHERNLDWQRDLEIEFSAGKISAQDYQTQKSLLSAELSRLEQQTYQLHALPADADGVKIESLISSRKMERAERSAGFCSKCGAPLQRSDLFCPGCGLKQK